MKYSILSLLSLSLLMTNLCRAQIPTVDVKSNTTYAEQKEIANNVSSKTSLLPNKMPDAKSMVSINQSGDGIINMPLVTVKGRKLSLPISLNYVTSGVKVDQQASEVGLGWNISFGSITRDYGAYEPDYTYNGSEFSMQGWQGNGNTTNDKAITSLHYALNLITNTYNLATTTLYTLINQNKVIDYNNATGVAPDNYEINIPGQKGNDFWNFGAVSVSPGAATPTDANFVFTQNVPWKISYEKNTFTVSQEVSRINEFTYKDYGGGYLDNGGLNPSYNVAAAIALYPYVKNQQFGGLVSAEVLSGWGWTDFSNTQQTVSSPDIESPNTDVKYEDYSKFTVTTSDGTQYIFGRPLRGQKYFFTEEPFWSAMSTTPYLSPSLAPGSLSNDRSFDEFWKTDYIAEWLLTEVRSNDFVDANNDGIADDGDGGDWIRITYADSIQWEVGPELPFAKPVPKHREWMGFTQTDRPSSLMRERAYVTQITTPVETLNFTNSERFDIDYDYSNAVFNRVSHTTYNSDYVYNQANLTDPTPGLCATCVRTLTGAAPDIYETNVSVNYPVELRRYDAISVNENISSNNNLIQNINLNYAPKGSAQELAVSNLLILDNNKNFTTYVPESTSLAMSTFYHPDNGTYNGRGKTTLLGIDFRGNNPASADKVSYSFGYANNPRYDSIHSRQIWKQLAFPSVRQALRSDWSWWPGIRAININGGIYDIPNSIMPWKTLSVNESNIFSYTTNLGFPVWEDELGYYYDPSQNINGRDAWSLSTINLPYGGNINISYDQDQIDIDNDRINWIAQGIPDYCIPSAGHYNNIAYMRDIQQARLNTLQESGTQCPVGDLLDLCNQYYFMLNGNSGGLRIKQINIVDNYGAPTITKNYQYGLGHYNMPPADYWNNYLTGLGEFVYDEIAKHETNQQFDLNVQFPDYSDYNNTMTRLMSNVRVDNSIKNQAQHYYEYIDEVNADNSKTRWYYGQQYNSFNNPAPGKVYYNIQDGVAKVSGVGNNYDRNNMVEVMATDIDHSKDIGNYKTEYYNSLGSMVQQTQTDCSFTENNSNQIQLGEVHFTGTYPYNQYVVDMSNSVFGTLGSGNFNIQLEPITSGGGKNFFADFSSTALSGMKYYYNSNGTNGTPTIDARSEASYPLFKIAWDCGFFAGTDLPSWLWPVTLNLPPVWGNNTSSVSEIHTDYVNFYNESIALTPSFYYVDDQNYLSGLTYKHQQSYQLHPIHVQTIKFF